MPAYNAGKYINEAINSILQQTYGNWELLICDDCSSDNTSQILNQFNDPRIRKFRNENNLGYLRTCNFLFAQCAGSFITFQDADDYCSPDRLQKLINAFNLFPDAAMIGSYAKIVDESGAFIRNDERELSYKSILENLPVKSQFNGATVMFKKMILKTIGGYREYFNEFAYQDYDWTYRIAEKYVSINIPEYLYSYRQQPNSNSKKISPKRAISHQLVLWLARDRAKNKNDYLDRGEVTPVNQFVEDTLLPYHNDPSLIYREYASSFMYSRLYRQAISASILAIKSRPLKFVNIRTLLYCLRKSLLS